MDHDKKGGGDAQGCRVVFSDIDGTLLDSSHQVTRATREEIRKLERQGIPFVLVSARMPEAMTTIQAQIGIHSPMVCYSGALRCLGGEAMVECKSGQAHPPDVSLV